MKLKIQGSRHHRNQVPEMLTWAPAHSYAPVKYLLGSLPLARLPVPCPPALYIGLLFLSHFVKLSSRWCSEPKPHLNVITGWYLSKGSPILYIPDDGDSCYWYNPGLCLLCWLFYFYVYLEPAIKVSLEPFWQFYISSNPVFLHWVKISNTK